MQCLGASWFASLTGGWPVRAPAEVGRRPSLKTGGAPTTIPPVLAMCLRLRRKNIADTGGIVVGTPPVFKEVRRPPAAGARTGQPPLKEASQEAPKHCTGLWFNGLGAVNRQPWYPDRRGSGWVSSPEKVS